MTFEEYLIVDSQLRKFNSEDSIRRIEVKHTTKALWCESTNSYSWQYFKNAVAESLIKGSDEVYGVKARRCKNRIKCNHCGSIIESKHRHDFVKCSCGKVYVDGGMDYFRWGGNEGDYTPIP